MGLALGLEVSALGLEVSGSVVLEVLALGVSEVAQVAHRNQYLTGTP